MKSRTPADVVQAQLDAYNAQDLDLFCSLYAEDCIIADLNGAVTQTGREAVRARYAQTWSQYPLNKAKAVNRIAFGNTVVDHEQVERAPGGERLEVIVVYTVRDGLIARADFAR